VRLQQLGGRGVVLGVLAVLSGCGSDAPQIVPVKGVVTYQGKPVAKLSVAFIPADGLLATGTTDANGKFELMTNKPGDGAMPGTYKVAVSFAPDEIPPMPGMEPPGYQPPVSPIPEKYADASTSGLTQTVEKDASKNDLTIALTD
jgi:hypothetical protein